MAPQAEGASQGQLVTLGPFCVLDFIVLSAQKGGQVDQLWVTNTTMLYFPLKLDFSGLYSM